MDNQTISPAALCEALGGRLRQARLNQDLTQKEVAQRAGLSVKAVQSVETGTATLLSTVAVLQALGLAGQLDLFLPVQEISPLQLARLRGKRRQRASGSRAATSTGDDTPW